MKLRIFTFSIVMLSLAVMSSCSKKEGCMDPTADNYDPDAKVACSDCCEFPTTTQNNQQVVPTFAGEYAALVAIKSVSTTSTPVGPIENTIGLAVAVFADAAGNLVNAGDVSVDSRALKQSSNNSYHYELSASNPTGLSFGSTVAWSASGADFPSFSGSTSVGFPDVSAITSGDVTVANNYTLTTTNVSNADSVYFSIYGANGNYVQKVLPGNTESYEFTNTELSNLGTGTGMVQIAGMNYDEQTLSSKPVWFINETVVTKTVELK